MKIGADQFRLEAPQLSAEKLPAALAQRAIDARVLSGALEAWKGNQVQSQAVVKPGTIRSIHLMDSDGSSGGPFLAHWPLNVVVARGPIPGDTNEITYYCGDGAPKVTNIPLATDAPPVGTAGAYPYRWLTLGVPTPVTAPLIEVSAPENVVSDVPVTNPGAESGITGWTVTTGDLISDPDGPYAGARSFRGGDAAVTEAYQSILLSSADVIPGQKLRIRFMQRSDSSSATTGATAAMGVRYYNASSVLIEERWAAQSSTEDAWVPRDVDGGEIPSGSVTMRLVQRFVRTGSGPGEIDARIEGIAVVALGADLYWDGSSLEGWTASRTENSDVEANDAGYADLTPAIKFNSAHSGVATLFAALNTKNSPAYTINFEYHTNNYVSLGVALDCDPAGNGWQLAFTHDGIFLQQTAAWGTNYVSQTRLTSVSHRQVHFRGVIVVTAVAGKKQVSVQTTRFSNGSALDSATASFEPVGDYLGLRAWDTGRQWQDGRLGKIAISISPAARPTTGDGGDLTGQTYTRYVYTWVSTLGPLKMLSAPSEASTRVRLGPEPAVKVTTPTTAPAGHGITEKWIWREATSSEGETAFQIVAKLPMGTADFMDYQTDSVLGAEILESIGWAPPPSDAVSVVSGTNGITYYGAGNMVYPTPVNRPHACPPLWAKTLDDEFVGMAAIKSDVYVLTAGQGHVITGTDPSSLRMDKLNKPLACASARGIAVHERWGVIYPSLDGLAYANGLETDLLTQGLMSEREWGAFNPSSITGMVYDGHYVGFYDTGSTQAGFIVDLRENGLGIGGLSFHATALWLNRRTGNLHMVVGGQHVTFNTATALRTFSWWSRDFLIDDPAWFQFGRIELASGSGAVTLEVFSDDALVHTRSVSTSDEFRLPPNVAKHSVSFRLSGSRKVKRIVLAEDLDEILS